jgi:hypothetical protein
MRPHLREFLELCARTLVCPQPIVEIGAFQTAGQEAIADVRPLFPGKHNIGCDMRRGPHRRRPRTFAARLNLPGKNALVGFSDPVDLSKSAITLVYWV